MSEEQFKEIEVKSETESLLKKMPGDDNKFDFKGVLGPALIIMAIVIGGAISGYFLASQGRREVAKKETELIGGAKIVEGPKEVGIKDEKVFRDTAQGRIETNENEEEAEGSHKLIRSGGKSQTAYLTSSVLDLNQFLGKCVQVWGETFKAQSVSWLMDVGRIKILDSCPEGV